MAHRTLKKSSYENLVDRLNRFPQGAPPSQTLYKILKILVSEREAGLVALLPIKPFKAPEAARRWKMSEAEARKVLEYNVRELEKGGEKYDSSKLQQQAIINIEDAKGLEEEDWNKTRKSMRKEQHTNEAQQGW